MSTDTVNSQLTVLLFSDIVDSTGLKGRLGQAEYARVLRRHNEMFESLEKQLTGARILKHTGDGYIVSFASASEAVRFALSVQASMRIETWSGEPLRTRMAIHIGEVVQMTMANRADVVGLAADTAHRLMSIGFGGQVLLTRFVFNEARQYVGHHPVVGADPSSGLLPLKWVAHGPYKFKGLEEPLEVFEVGVEGRAPLKPPLDGEKARRIVDTHAGALLGWRPAIALEVPGRPGWTLIKKLGDTDYGEMWLADNPNHPKPRVYQFFFEPGSRAHFGQCMTVLHGAGVTPPQVQNDSDDPLVIESELRDTPTSGAEGDSDPHVSAGSSGSTPLGPPRQIGPYLIGRKLGEGGMGEVYAAEQLSPIRRSVALKLIKPGMDSREVLARFDAERQALALMDHHSIARVFDAGADERGRPYFVMEFVAGVPITEYCDKHNLTTRERLELFIPICDAIQHAHNKGIIHRDIKPTNVLVALRDGKPVPVVIDFGVAKATVQQLTEHRIFTEVGRIIGTPEYISPEQAEMSALDIDTRTDVYSLGVLLYELLTGALPFDPKTLRSAAYNEIRRIIREVDPPRPCVRLTGLEVEKATQIAQHRRESVPDLAEELRRELEWIPLKAMRKNREERYESAVELGRDVRNYLSGLPLRAGPESVRYKVYKFLRRNRPRVMATAVAAGIVLGTVIVFVTLLARQRDLALKAGEQSKIDRAARDVSSKVTLEAIRELARTGEHKTPEQVAKTVEMYKQAMRQQPTDPLLRVEAANAFSGLGVELTNIDPPGAAAVLGDALSLRERLVTESPGDPQSQRDLAAARNNLANALYLAVRNSNQGPDRFDEAKKHYEAAESTLQELARSQPDNLDWQLCYATQLHNLGSFYRAIGESQQATAKYQAAQAITEKIANAPDLQENVLFSALRDYAATCEALAMVHEDAGKIQDAAKSYEKACKVRRHLAQRVDTPQATVEWARTLGHWGQLLVRSGDATGRDKTEQAMRIWQGLMGQSDYRTVQPVNAEAYAHIAWLKLLKGDFAEALRAAELASEFDPKSLAAAESKLHALLFNDRADEAKKVLLENFTRAAGDGSNFAETIKRDFVTLRAFWPEPKGMKDIEAMISSTAAAP